ncbi:hypothetical protein BV898_15789 [Hypsibius exemplaris]|uniref:Receptor ligand binding region domain-containing protein n=1 Tax=Hypsibius exemplaris TaxID=2072580 RepID=A0A9X6NDG8_HYPEX|nr:hypothetical protein BV898_15789 [Hypsibius exemplaris]
MKTAFFLMIFGRSVHLSESRNSMRNATITWTPVLNFYSIPLGTSPSAGFNVMQPLFNTTLEMQSRLYPRVFANYTYAAKISQRSPSCGPEGAEAVIGMMTETFAEESRSTNADKSRSLTVFFLPGYNLFASTNIDRRLITKDRFPSTVSFAPTDTMVYGAAVIALTRHYAWRSIAVINDRLSGSSLMTRNSEHCRAPLEQLDLLRKSIESLTITMDSGRENFTRALVAAANFSRSRRPSELTIHNPDTLAIPKTVRQNHPDKPSHRQTNQAFGPSHDQRPRPSRTVLLSAYRLSNRPTIYHLALLPTTFTDVVIIRTCRLLRQPTDLILICTLCSPQRHALVFLHLYELEVPGEPPLTWLINDSLDKKLWTAFQNLLVVGSPPIDWETFDAPARLIHHQREQLLRKSVGRERNEFEVGCYEAVTGVAKALNESYDSEDSSWLSGRYMATAITNRTFDFPLRSITITEKGIRSIMAAVEYFDKNSSTFKFLYTYNPDQATLKSSEMIPARWVKGAVIPDRPPCGLRGQYCLRSSWTSILVPSVVFCLCVVSITMLVVRYLIQQRLLYLTWWEIASSDLIIKSHRTASLWSFAQSLVRLVDCIGRAHISDRF